MAEDYYKTLNISRDASQADIKKAYRDLARKYHPDLNPDDKDATRKFQEVQAAFDVLNDPKKREMYDRYGSAFEGASAAGPRAGGTWTGPPGAGFEDVDLSQFFGERFGGDAGHAGGGFADIFSQFRRARSADAGRAARGRPARPVPRLETELQVPFVTSVEGGEAELQVRRESGRVETIKVKIPAGIEDGKKIRLRGQHQPGPDATVRGDILITIHVAPHPWYYRRGNNLHVKVPLTILEAIEGAKVDIPTPAGTVTLRVPPNTSGGTKLRIKGHGVKPPGKAVGDLFAEIHIVVPTESDEESLRLIREIDRRQPMTPRDGLRW